MVNKRELRNDFGEIYAFISKERGQPWIYVQWIGQIDTELLKQGIVEISKMMDEERCAFILSDRRVAQGNWFEINNWLQHKWAPKAVKSGVQYLAHVVAPLASSQMASLDMESRILGFEFKSFDSLEEAQSWLTEMAREHQS